MYFFVVFLLNLCILAFVVYSIVQKVKGKPNRFFTFPLPNTLDRFGVQLGLRLSLVLSLTYAFIGVFVVELSVTLDITNFIIVWTLGLPFIFLLGILPAVIYGFSTGYLFGVIVHNFRKLFPSLAFVIIGMTLCAVITTLSHYLFGVQITFSFVNKSANLANYGVYETYPFYIGIPSVIYILSGGWACWYIHKKSDMVLSNGSIS